VLFESSCISVANLVKKNLLQCQMYGIFPFYCCALLNIYTASYNNNNNDDNSNNNNKRDSDSPPEVETWEVEPPVEIQKLKFVLQIAAKPSQIYRNGYHREPIMGNRISSEDVKKQT